jgi:hypothetical protein
MFFRAPLLAALAICAMGVPGLCEPRVVDANGDFVGELVAPDEIAITISGVAVLFAYADGTLSSSGGPGLEYFASTDCTGQAYLDASDLPVNSFVSLGVGDSNIYMPQPPFMHRTFGSVRASYAELIGCQTQGTDIPLSGAMVAIDMGALGLTPPFSVKIH